MASGSHDEWADPVPTTLGEALQNVSSNLRAFSVDRVRLTEEYCSTTPDAMRRETAASTDLLPGLRDNENTSSRRRNSGGDTVRTVSPTTFVREYVARSRPCVIVGAMTHWPAMHKWQDDAYLFDLRGAPALGGGPVDRRRDSATTAPATPCKRAVATRRRVTGTAAASASNTARSSAASPMKRAPRIPRTVTVALTPNGRADCVSRVRHCVRRGGSPSCGSDSPELREETLFMCPAEVKVTLPELYTLFEQNSVGAGAEDGATALPLSSDLVDLSQPSTQKRVVAYAQLQNNCFRTEYRHLHGDVQSDLLRFGVKVFGATPEVKEETPPRVRRASRKASVRSTPRARAPSKPLLRCSSGTQHAENRPSRSVVRGHRGKAGIVPRRRVMDAEACAGYSDVVENVWFGTSGVSVTSLHQDWYENLYAVVRGVKQFFLIPPWDGLHVRKLLYKSREYQVERDPSKPVAFRFLSTVRSPLTLGGCDAPSNIDGLTKGSCSSCEREPGCPAPTGQKDQCDTDNSDADMVPWIELDLHEAAQRGTLPAELENRIHPITVSVNAGEALYLPAAWFHRVSQFAAADESGDAAAASALAASLTQPRQWKSKARHAVNRYAVREVDGTRYGGSAASLTAEKAKPESVAKRLRQLRRRSAQAATGGGRGSPRRAPSTPPPKPLRPLPLIAAVNYWFEMDFMNPSAVLLRELRHLTGEGV